MPDVLTPQEQAAIAEALARIPADQRRVPIGATAYPAPVWDGSKLAYRDADRRRREAQLAGVQTRRGLQLERQRRSQTERNAQVCSELRAGDPETALDRAMARFELSEAAVREIARAAGLRLLTRQQIEARRLTRVIRALADGRRDLQEVARLAGCSRNAVAARRKAYGLDILDGAGGRPQKAGVA